MIATTTHSTGGHRMTGDVGLVVGRSIIGATVVTDPEAEFRDSVGRRIDIEATRDGGMITVWSRGAAPLLPG